MLFQHWNYQSDRNDQFQRLVIFRRIFFHSLLRYKLFLASYTLVLHFNGQNLFSNKIHYERKGFFKYFSIGYVYSLSLSICTL